MPQVRLHRGAHRPGSDRLICLYCRHEWAATRVEEAFGLGEGIADLRGTQIASGARDIAADAPACAATSAAAAAPRW
jgi:hypothetical protein